MDPITDIEDLATGDSTTDIRQAKVSLPDAVIDDIVLALYQSHTSHYSDAVVAKRQWNYSLVIQQLMKKMKRDMERDRKRKDQKEKIQNSLSGVGYPDKNDIQAAYQRLIGDGRIPASGDFERKMRIKSVRSNSGVVVITVMTTPFIENDEGKPPESFSCAYDCFMCPNEFEIIYEESVDPVTNEVVKKEKKVYYPRSYRKGEDATDKGYKQNYDAVKQCMYTFAHFANTGHSVDKLEFIVKGGTFSLYPREYRRRFIRDLFYAANMLQHIDITEYSKNRTPELLDKLIASFPRKCHDDQRLEHIENEKAPNKIIGVTIETRPDQIGKKSNRELREDGVTRVELGIQSDDDEVLKLMNRGCGTRHSFAAIRKLKNDGFKVDAHLMLRNPRPLTDDSNVYVPLDISGYDPSVSWPKFSIETSAEKDCEMIDNIVSNEDYQVDQWKIYPVEISPFTTYYEWYKQGIYRPYGFKKLVKVLTHTMSKVPPHVRVNRISRGIIIKAGMTGDKKLDKYSSLSSSIRDHVERGMEKDGIPRMDIRSREIRNRNVNDYTFVLKTREHIGSGSREFFLSFETEDEKILAGFLRLRLPSEEINDTFPELSGAALIREAHVFGDMIKTEEKYAATQNRGFGRRLIASAEEISIQNGYKKISVISGVGARNYYRKFGYEIEGNYGYMIKHLNPSSGWFHMIKTYFGY